MRYARKRDLSESPIVKALRTVGADVQTGTDCDLYVYFKGKGWMLECKTAGNNAKRRQKVQERLAAIFGPQYRIVKDPTEALTAIGYYQN